MTAKPSWGQDTSMVASLVEPQDSATNFPTLTNETQIVATLPTTTPLIWKSGSPMTFVKFIFRTLADCWGTEC